MVLMKHEAWRNPELWGATLDELIARDKQRWMNLQVNERVSLLQCQCNSVTLCIYLHATMSKHRGHHHSLRVAPV